MNPVPPLTTMFMEFMRFGGAEQADLLWHAHALPGLGYTLDEFSQDAEMVAFLTRPTWWADEKSGFLSIL